MTSHRGKRPSVRVGRKLPKRATCPDCGKKGVGIEKALPMGVRIRECQYCAAVFKVAEPTTSANAARDVEEALADRNLQP